MSVCLLVIISVPRVCMERVRKWVSYYTKVVWQEAVAIYTSQLHSISSILYESFYSKISLQVKGSKFVLRQLIYPTRTSGTWVLVPALSQGVL